MKNEKAVRLWVTGASIGLAMLISGGAGSVEASFSRGLTMAEAIASGQCEEGDSSCLDELMAGTDNEVREDTDSKKTKKGGPEDKKSDRKRSKDDDKSRDGKSDDKGSKDDDSDSRDGKSTTRGSKDDDSDSRDGKSDDKGSKDDDSDSGDGKSDDKGSKDDDSDSGDGKSDDKGSKDDDSDSGDGKSDDDSSSDDGAMTLPDISISNGEGTEFNEITQVPVELSIMLSAPSGEAVIADWITENGTAEAGSDYVFASGQVTIPAGALAVGITVFVIGDDTSEPTESFFVRLSMSVGANIVGPPGEVLIIDDDDLDD